MTKKNRIKPVCLGVLACLFLAGISLVGFSSTSKAKATLAKKTTTLAVCGTETIKVKSLPKKAKLKFKTSKKTVAKVSSKGKVTAIAAGTAKIKVTYKLKGKTKNVGTFKVTVKKSSITPYVDQIGYGLLTQTGYYSVKEHQFYFFEDGGEQWLINYYNKKAKYTYASSDTKLMTITSSGYVTSVNGKDGQTVYVIIKETYKKKTRTVGKVKVTLYAPCISDLVKTTQNILLGRKFILGGMLNWVDDYFFVVTDEEGVPDPNDDYTDDGNVEFVKDENGGWNGELIFKKEGIYYGYAYAYNYVTGKYDTDYFGRIVFNIDPGETSLGSLSLGVLDDDEDTIEYTSSLDFGSYYKRIYIKPDKDNYIGEMSVTSSDPSIATVTKVKEDRDGEYGTYGYFYISPIKSGKTTVTVSAGGVEKSIDVTVGSEFGVIGSDDWITIGGVFDDPGNYDESKFTYKFSNDMGLDVDIWSYSYDGHVSYEVELSSDSVDQEKTSKLTILYDGKEIAKYDIVLTE